MLHNFIVNRVITVFVQYVRDKPSFYTYGGGVMIHKNYGLVNTLVLKDCLVISFNSFCKTGLNPFHILTAINNRSGLNKNIYLHISQSLESSKFRQFHISST